VCGLCWGCAGAGSAEQVDAVCVWSPVRVRRGQVREELPTRHAMERHAALPGSNHQRGDLRDEHIDRGV
jgi:hypothetical protein